MPKELKEERDKKNDKKGKIECFNPHREIHFDLEQ